MIMKKILFFSLFLFVSLNLFAQTTYYTTGTGDWFNSKWAIDTNGTGAGFVDGANPSINGTPIVNGDIIYIDDDTDITSADVNLESVDIKIVIDATLDIAKKLRLSENSSIEFTENGQLNDIGPGNSEKIGFGGTFVWTGKDGPEAGPGTMDRNYDPATGLPIELKSFTASKSGKSIDLDGVTAKEENFSHFEIERSLDQENWSQLGLVQGMGESMSDVYYDFTDRNAPFGVIYYRLKSVDIDASYEYSPVVKIEVGFEGKLAVSPNPVQDASNLKIQVPNEFRDDLAYVGLFDLSGIKVQEFRNFDAEGSLQINQQLKAGMYILKVNHNGLQENIRVIVQ